MSTLFLRRKANQQKKDNNTTPLQQFAAEDKDAAEPEPDQDEFDMAELQAGLNKAVDLQNENNVQEDSLSDEQNVGGNDDQEYMSSQKLSDSGDEGAAPKKSEDNLQKVEALQKPEEPSYMDINDELRKINGYDLDNLYKDSEENEEGMMKKLGLTNQIELQDEIQKRKDECQYRKKMVMFQYEKKMETYKEFVKQNPHLYKSVQETTKKRKLNSLQNKAQSKRIRMASQSDEFSEKEEEESNSDFADSDFGDQKQGKNRRKLKQMDKLNGSSSKPLDNFRAHQLSDDEKDAKEEYLQQNSGMRYSYEKNEEQRRQKKERDDQRERMLSDKSFRNATLEDLKQANLRRSKIEQWVDEPFFDKTMIGAFVRINLSKRDIIVAEVRDVKDDEDNFYSLTNGKKTGKYLKLLVTDDTDDKLKWYKINQISNQDISQNEFDLTLRIRAMSKVQAINQKMTFLKKEDIIKARNYEYNKGELADISMRKFERSLKKNDLSGFNNITYFQKLKMQLKNDLEEQLKELEQKSHKNNQDNVRDLDAYTKVSNSDLIKKLNSDISQLDADLKKIEDHLKMDLRVSRFGKKELIEDIEEAENKKIYQDWLDEQEKKNEGEEAKKKFASSNQIPETEALVHLDQKEALFFEIKKIQEKYAQNQSRSGAQMGILSYYERIQKQKHDILKSHEEIGLGLLNAKGISKEQFLKRIKSQNFVAQQSSKANPELLKLIQQSRVVPEKAISLEQFLKSQK